MEWFAAGDPRERLGPVNGAHGLFLDAGANFAVAAECYLARWLTQVHLVVLPELRAIAADTERLLRRFVERGGRLLVTGRVPEVAGKPMDWFGVRQEPEPWQDHVYLPRWATSVNELPILVRGDFCRVELQGATGMHNAIAPYDAQPGRRYGWGIGPPCEQPSPHPALTRHRIGEGEAWHLGVPIFSDYARHGNWQQVQWWSNLLREINAPRRAWIESPYGGVELVLWENEKSSWAILIQHGSEQLIGDARVWSRTVGPMPRRQVVLRLESKGRTPRRAAFAGQDLAWERQGQEIILPVVLDSVWGVVHVDWGSRKIGGKMR
jgi:hypothetical protein